MAAPGKSLSCIFYTELANSLQKLIIVEIDGGAPPGPEAEVRQDEANQPERGANQPNPVEEGQREGDALHPVPPAAAAPKTAPGLRTLSIKVTDGSSAASQPLALPAANETLAKLLDSISSGGLARGKLPEFTDRALASLTANYATNPGSGTHIEPADLTEKQWDTILKNNRALHGYWYDWDRNILVKASKKGKICLSLGCIVC